jgi:uncharacterized protein
MPASTDLADRVAAAIEARDESAVRDLVAAQPAVAGTVDAAGRSLLLLALFHRLDGAAAVLLSHRGDDLDVLEAAATGRAERLRHLLSADRAGSLAARTPEGFDPLSLAAFLGGADAVEVLLAHGADPEGDDANTLGIRPVHAAAAARDAAAMRHLLDAGADPDSPQRGGIVALHAAAQHDDLELAQVLLDHGADPTRRADDGRDPAAFAADAGAERVLATLRAAA